MLREIIPVSQKSGEPKRRWFCCEIMDLFIWLNDQDEVVSYQLSYDKPHAEKALTWQQGQGFAHVSVDDGSRPGKYPASPLLSPEANFNAKKLLSLFKSNAGDMDSTIATFIVSSIENYYQKQG